MLLLLLSGATFVPATLLETGGGIKGADYPNDAIRRSESGTISVWLAIDRTGHIESCKARLKTTGDVLEKATCALIRRRFRFASARNNEGMPSYGVTFHTIHWSMPDSKQKQYVFDEMILKVSALPPGMVSGDRLPLALLISPDGTIKGCRPVSDEANASLARLACRSATSQFHPEPFVNAAGETVEAVREIGVRFVVDGNASKIPTEK